MFKSLARNVANWAMGAVIFSAVGAAFAVTGNPPLPYIENTLPDATWLNGLAGGQNFSYQSGIVAKGSATQATATQLAAGIFMQEVDTSTSSTGLGVALPICVQGAAINLFNNTANTIDVYPSVANNQLLSPAAQDVIVSGGSAGTTSTTITEYTGKLFTCAVNGTWSAH